DSSVPFAAAVERREREETESTPCNASCQIEERVSVGDEDDTFVPLNPNNGRKSHNSTDRPDSWLLLIPTHVMRSPI
ncbi:unnamed protein product, partial [Linum tenue]